jgi:hypothetical protein
MRVYGKLQKEWKKHVVNRSVFLYLQPLRNFQRKLISGCSVARLSRLLWEQEAAGSNPATPTKQSPALSCRAFLLD